MVAYSPSYAEPRRHPPSPRYDAADYLTRLSREAPLMLFVFLILSVVGVFGASQLKTKYPVYSSVLVRLGQEYVYEPRAGDAGRGAVPGPDQVIQAETEILGSVELKQKVIKRLGLSRIYPQLASKYATGDARVRKRAMADALQAFEKSTKIETAPDTPIIKVTFKGQDPEVAAQVLNTLLEEYLIYRRGILGDTTGPAVAEQRDGLEKRLDQVDRALQDFLVVNQIGDFATEKASLGQITAQVEQQKLQTEAQLQERIARLANLSSQMNGLSKEVGLYRDISGAANDKLAALRVQREDLLSRYRTDSRPLQDVDNQIAQLEAGMAAGRTRTEGAKRLGINPVYQTVETERVQVTADVAALRQSLAALSLQVQQLTRRSLKMAELEPQFQKLSLEREVLQNNVRDYTVKAIQGRASQDLANSESDNIRIVSRAIAPTKGVSLKRPVAGLAVIFAAFTALCVGLVRMLLRPGIATPQAAERTFELPVLASARFKAG